MSSHHATDRIHSIGLGLLLCGSAVAQQPLCDVLLRPAFHYSTQGLDVAFADSSTTFGILAASTWNFGDGTGLTTAPQHTYEDPGEYTVCLTLTSLQPPCSSTYCALISVPLDDCGVLEAQFDLNYASTNAAAFTDLGVASFTGTHLWQFGDGSTSTDAAPSHTWALPGPHFVTLTKSEGNCTASYGRWVNVDGNATTCGPDLFVDLNTSSDAAYVFLQPTIVVNNNVIPVINIWSYGDGTGDSAAVGMHEYAELGTYQICLLVGAYVPGAGDTCFSLVCETIELAAASGLEELDQRILHTWPVPFVDELHIATHIEDVHRLQVLDMAGRIVAQETLPTSGTITMDLVQLPAGVYLVDLRGGHERYLSRVVKVQE